MNCLIFFTIILFALILNVYGRTVKFSLITFGNNATVTFNNKTLDLKPIDNFSRVYSISSECPDKEFR